ncbi:hypothetical protein [Burkholderia metallica]|uniref:hypothetical protein n=1 Tax=Burkholderia metallica TaxID=488729 RepID=UPI0012F4BB15|nr:hypothetical protein [Burkholderia metallica]
MNHFHLTTLRISGNYNRNPTPLSSILQFFSKVSIRTSKGTPADRVAAELDECTANVRAVLETNTEAADVIQPGMGALSVSALSKHAGGPGLLPNRSLDGCSNSSIRIRNSSPMIGWLIACASTVAMPEVDRSPHQLAAPIGTF